jgi:D-alanyl-lipoteichoic acid acyltransferase DltB (MBOAT superfamily)
VGNIVDFGLYVSFFPQIVAGPIERIQKLLPQIQAPRIWKAEFFSAAWPLLVMGIFKKVVVADTMSSIVDRIFNMQSPSKALVLVAALGFTLQILADFSGYTDMARGIALLFGFETSENFNKPYLALTPSDFWNRWHITLSNFLRDYIFFPLRRALLKKRTLPSWLVQTVPPLVTMFVSGLWHGAGWTYLVWGIYYGALIVIYQSSGIQLDWKQSNKLKSLVAWLVMFSLVVFGWFLFRAPSIGWAGKVLLRAAWLTKPQDAIIALMILGMVTAYAFPLILKLFIDRFSKPGSWGQAVYFALITLAVIVYTNSSNPDFIYFQF